MSGSMQEALAKALTPEAHTRFQLKTKTRKVQPTAMTEIRTDKDIDLEIEALQQKIAGLKKERDLLTVSVDVRGDIVTITGLAECPIQTSRARLYVFIKQRGLALLKDSTVKAPTL